MESFTNAADFGFSPDTAPMENVKALQAAVDNGGTIIVSQPGTYEVGGTVYVGSNTTIKFGNGVSLKKVDAEGIFTHVLLNKGALTRTYDENIVVEGLHIIVNGIDKPMSEVFGLRGQIAFFYIKDLRIERFRCYDLDTMQFAIHICTFEDIIVNDVIIKGNKDGVHLGRGNRFTISNGVFQTYDDAVALNAQDYSTSNPELGWIENGVVQNCYDLPDGKDPVGFFCRILAGGWIDWREGMEVQQSDTVISNGRMYRVQANPDGTVYKSVTRPTHVTPSEVLDGIRWGYVQDHLTYTAGVRNVVFRDIVLKKPRPGFSAHFDQGRFSRSYYPGAEYPVQEKLLFDNIRVQHDTEMQFVGIATPVDVLTITNSCFKKGKIRFFSNADMADYGETLVNLTGCVFNDVPPEDIIDNTVEGKVIHFREYASAVLKK
jgi:hypothetical protein